MNYNENYIHVCEVPPVEIKHFQKSLIDIYSEEELKEILDFYLFHPCVLKDEKQNRKFGNKCLKDYQWYGNSGKTSLSALEGKMLKTASLASFCILKSDRIVETLNAMNLQGDKICVEHPRAVIKQLVEVSILENGQTKIEDKEKRLVCLFRHIRNSIAHNCTYFFDNGNIMLDDYDDSFKNLSARILIPKNALLEWKRIVCKDNE